MLMPTKYNLALIPIKDDENKFITYARSTFPIKPAEYLLGSHSIPHVTLCHFEAEESDLAVIVERVRALKQPPIQLTFSTQRNKTYPSHPIWGKWSWVSLIPDKLEELKQLHLQIAEIVTPLNAAFDDYDPHMTLFNSRDEERCGMINHTPHVNPFLSGTFEIKLGKLDDAGQITEILNMEDLS